MKVLPGYLMLLTFYITETAKLPDKIGSQVSTQITPTGRAIGKLDNGVTKLRGTSTTARSTTFIPTKVIRERKKPAPKKYTPTTPKTVTTGPLKISLTKPTKISSKIRKSAHTIELICPSQKEANFELFAPSCKSDRDCTAWNKNQRCCKLFGSRNCVKGVPKPLEEQVHAPFLGLIPRKCPEIPLAELWWDLKTCDTDNDCWPRICCPDGQAKYCRTSAPQYESVPPPIGRSIAYLSEYLECTPAPPAVFDLHPKQCDSTLDCFPNVCCQESGRKFCRPPKKSVLTVMANFLNIGLVKRLTRNLVIK